MFFSVTTSSGQAKRGRTHREQLEEQPGEGINCERRRTTHTILHELFYDDCFLPWTSTPSLLGRGQRQNSQKRGSQQTPFIEANAEGPLCGGRRSARTGRGRESRHVSFSRRLKVFGSCRRCVSKLLGFHLFFWRLQEHPLRFVFSSLASSLLSRRRTTPIRVSSSFSRSTDRTSRHHILLASPSPIYVLIDWVSWIS